MSAKPHKKIILHSYNPDWPKMYGVEANDLMQFLGPHCVALHHMGSTSVPDLTAKEDLDIMCIVDDLKSSLVLQNHGFVFKGEGNIPLRYFFSKNTERSKVNLHVVEADHGFILWNLTFRDYLRTHSEASDAYGALKQEIIKDESSGERIQNLMPRYTYDKSHFIHEILNKAGFDDFTINFCFHKNEWEAYHRIRQEQIFAGQPYDVNDPIYTSPDHFHFVLYKGTNVAVIAHIEVSGDMAQIREMAVDKPYQGKGFDLKLRKLIKKWANLHEYKLQRS